MSQGSLGEGVGAPLAAGAARLEDDEDFPDDREDLPEERDFSLECVSRCCFMLSARVNFLGHPK